jgi:hypothetical protein
MKKITCNALKGACEAEILGATPEEMAENAKKHAMEMMGKGDEAHKAAAMKMMEMSSEDQQKWYEEFKAEFDALPEV